MNEIFDETKCIPCPICGSKEVNLDFDADVGMTQDGKPYYIIECSNEKCGAFVGAPTLDEAMKEWNEGLAE